MPIFSTTFHALLKEAQFTCEMLGAGATQIRAANYAYKGLYFQAFTSLSTGMERVGKLCLMLDRYIETRGTFPDHKYLKSKIGHKIELLYERSQEIMKRRTLVLPHLQDLSAPPHSAILAVLHNYAEGDRYSNIDLLVGGRQSKDPIAEWFNAVDLPLFDSHVSARKKAAIFRNAAYVAKMMGGHAGVLHTSETGREITDLEEASRLTGMYGAVAPYRQLSVLQVIRYWVELLSELEHIAHREVHREDIPFFGELFAIFMNGDEYFRSRKTWQD